MIKLDISLQGVPVVIPTNDREIPGSTPGRYNFQIKITSHCSKFIVYQDWSKQHSNAHNLRCLLQIQQHDSEECFVSRLWGVVCPIWASSLTTSILAHSAAVCDAADSFAKRNQWRRSFSFSSFSRRITWASRSWASPSWPHNELHFTSNSWTPPCVSTCHLSTDTQVTWDNTSGLVGCTDCAIFSVSIFMAMVSLKMWRLNNAQRGLVEAEVQAEWTAWSLRWGV